MNLLTFRIFSLIGIHHIEKADFEMTIKIWSKIRVQKMAMAQSWSNIPDEVDLFLHWVSAQLLSHHLVS